MALTREEFNYEKFLIELKKGCHSDLACYCLIRDKIDNLKQSLGAQYFNLAMDAVCVTCDVSVDPINPNKDEPTIFEPEPQKDEPKPIVTRRRVLCPPPLENVFGQEIDES